MASLCVRLSLEFAFVENRSVLTHSSPFFVAVAFLHDGGISARIAHRSGYGTVRRL